MAPEQLQAPWHGFFVDLNAALAEQVALHCIGGFVISALYRMPRSTADIDFLAVVPIDQTQRLMELGGQGSLLQSETRDFRP